MIDRRCERNARPERDSIQHARYLARRDPAPLFARDCDGPEYVGVGCYYWLR